MVVRFRCTLLFRVVSCFVEEYCLECFLANYLIELGDVVENEDNAGNDDEMMTTMKEINVDFCGSNYVKTTLITDSLHW